ncbi:MAG: hypothetical protein PHH77_03470 [Victivallaceae bacterium]|nr:hypothetical protein [Victivallaceae bacterium]
MAEYKLLTRLKDKYFAAAPADETAKPAKDVKPQKVIKPADKKDGGKKQNDKK